jgi:hypothetical protein
LISRSPRISSICSRALRSSADLVAGEEVFEVAALEGFGFEGEVLVGAQVVHPQATGGGLGAAGAAFEEHVVGNDHRGPVIGLEQRLDVLHKVELLVGGGGPEVVPFIGDGFSAHIALFSNHLDQRLAPSWRRASP